jgi:hypothetical protein
LEIAIRNFNKDPIGIHHAANPAKTKLACDGFNFQIWEKELNRTLRQVFQVKNFSRLEANFTDRLLDKQDAIAGLIRSTINKDLLGIVDSTDKEDPWSIFELLKAKCSRSDCRHKLSLVDQIITLANDKSPGSEVSLAKWSRVMAEVAQYKITVDELGGLFLQSSFVAPIGVDPKTFEFSVNQNLELKDKPSFSDVTTVIQAASSKSKNKTPVVSDGYAPMNLDAVHAMRNNKPLYTAPHRRPHPPPQQDHQNYQKPGLSVERANRFRGKPLNEILKARYGDACHYCKQNGHWYNNCAAFWDDVDQKVIDSPPRDFDNPQSNYLPPHRPAMPQNRLRQLDVPEANDGKVLLDSGASTHVSGNLEIFVSREHLAIPRTISLAVADCKVDVRFKGRVRIQTPKGPIEFDNVYYCPGVDGLILSVGRLTSNGWRLCFDGKKAELISPSNICFTTRFRNFCWYLAMCKDALEINKVTTSPSFDPYLWHRRLGHVSETVVRKYLKIHYPEELEKKTWKSFFCEQCAISKALDQKSPGSNSLIPRDEPLDLLVSDVAGPFPYDISGRRYLLTLRDHATTYIWTAILVTRDQVPAQIMEWVENIKTTLGRYPKCIRTNNAPEYTGTLKKLLKPTGINYAPVPPYSPEQNGEAERVNQTLGDMARTMLHESKLPKIFWGHAYQAAGYIHNRIPNTKVPVAPLTQLYSTEVDPNKLYPFGASAILLIPKENRGKLDDRATEGQLVGYPMLGGGWLFWSESKGRIIHSTAVMFPEFQRLPVKKMAAPVQNPEPESTPEHDEPAKTSCLDIVLNQIMLKLGEEETDVCHEREQKAISELVLTEDRRILATIKRAAEYEVEKFKSLEVWEPIEPFQGAKALGCWWVFTIKPPDREGDPEIYQARYVAKGFNQQIGIDCNETYAPTASLNTLQPLLSLANKHGYATATFDVSSAYLYSPIEEEVYVQPPVKIMPHLKGKIMRLKKAMYGTKQAARCWWQFFKRKMEAVGFVASDLEQSFYIYRKGVDFVIIWLHVDDGLAVASNQLLLDNLRVEMQKEMNIKWADGVKRLVGLNIVTKDGEVILDQERLASQIVQDYERPIFTRRSPLPDNQLEVNTFEPVDQTNYRSIIGSLMYLACGTRPDLSFAVNLLARYCNNPSESHWLALDYLIGYIKRSQSTKLVFKGNNSNLDLWLDANMNGQLRVLLSSILGTPLHGVQNDKWW